MAQHRLALLRALPGYVRPPAQQNLAQIPDCGIDGCYQIDLTIGGVVVAVVTQP